MSNKIWFLLLMLRIVISIHNINISVSSFYNIINILFVIIALVFLVHQHRWRNTFVDIVALSSLYYRLFYRRYLIIITKIKSEVLVALLKRRLKLSMFWCTKLFTTRRHLHNLNSKLRITVIGNSSFTLSVIRPVISGNS